MGTRNKEASMVRIGVSDANGNYIFKDVPANYNTLDIGRSVRRRTY